LLAFKQLFFQRSNAINKPMIAADFMSLDITNTFVASLNNSDTLKDYIDCLYPISSSVESETEENLIRHGNMHAMQQFLYFFWSRRNAEDPWKGFSDYMIEVKKANQSFGTQIRKGYETDRGRVFLQYGPPNTISNGDEPGTNPYEIWHYYKLLDQSNRKFVFFANERSSNDYRLIHSDALGEINNPNWEKSIYSGRPFDSSLDPVKPLNMYGDHLEEKYTIPH
jgi:GWxTD domain-containing protein